jgi:hypothetical protein
MGLLNIDPFFVENLSLISVKHRCWAVPNLQLSTTNIINYQLSTINYQLINPLPSQFAIHAIDR